MTTLLRAEELALLMIREDGRLVAPGPEVDLVLAGALLADLEAEGFADLRRHTERDDQETVVGRRNRVRTRGEEPPSDPLLADAHAKASERRRGSALRRVAKGARTRVFARLAERELVSVSKKVINKTYRVLDADAVAQVRDRFHQILVNGLAPDPRTVSEIWLFDACANLGKALPGVDRGTIRQHRQRLPPRGWVEKQTKTEIDASRTVVVAG